MGPEALTGGGPRGAGQPRRAGPGGRAKSGKPRPGTGGQGKRKLAGKGPTPPAHLRPGHPAKRRAAAAARAGTGQGDGAARDAGRRGAGPRGAGSAPEVVAGRNAVLEALQAGVPATALYLGQRAGSGGQAAEAARLAAAARIPLAEAGRAELDRLTGGAVHQGLALRIRPYRYAHPDDLIARAAAAGEVPLIIALDGVTDPRNLGAVARSAAAFGAHGILVPARRAAGVTAGAWKASAGSLARLPVAQAPNLARALAAYQSAGLFAAGLDAGAAGTLAALPVADRPLVLVAGSEGRGLSRLVAQQCDLLVRIPMAAASESLNAGVAAGIALHEVAARRAALA